MTETENLIRDMARAIRPDLVWSNGLDGALKRDAMNKATAALLVALPRIGEMVSNKMETVFSEQYHDFWDAEDLAEHVPGDIRECLSTLETELRKGTDHG